MTEKSKPEWSAKGPFEIASGPDHPGAQGVLDSVSALEPGEGQKLRVGVTDWSLNLGADPEAVPLAAQLGFDGLQVSFGRKIVDGKMPLDNPELIRRYLSLSRQHNITIAATQVDQLHENGLKNDKLAPKWVLDAIRLTKALNVKIAMLPFFERCAMQSKNEMDYVGDLLRDLAPEAEKAGVILGLEDTISAQDNVRIMDRSRSANVLVYYDVGNSRKAGFGAGWALAGAVSKAVLRGEDAANFRAFGRRNSSRADSGRHSLHPLSLLHQLRVVQEIRWLGRHRICQFHFKDNPHYLGEGSIQFAPIVRVIRDIGFAGYANLETDVHPERLAPDMRRNLAYIRKIIEGAG